LHGQRDQVQADSSVLDILPQMRADRYMAFEQPFGRRYCPVWSIVALSIQVGIFIAMSSNCSDSN